MPTMLPTPSTAGQASSGTRRYPGPAPRPNSTKSVGREQCLPCPTVPGAKLPKDTAMGWQIVARLARGLKAVPALRASPVNGRSDDPVLTDGAITFRPYGPRSRTSSYRSSTMAHLKKSDTQQRKYSPRRSAGRLAMDCNFRRVRRLSSSLVFA